MCMGVSVMDCHGVERLTPVKKLSEKENWSVLNEGNI